MAVLSLHNVDYAIGSHPLLTDVSLHLHRSDRLCLTGRNGTGKSTLLRLASGRLEPDSGQLSKDADVQVAILDQEFDPGMTGSALSYASWADTATPDEPELQAARLHAAEEALTRLSVPFDTVLTSASGGMIRRVMLARVLASRAEVLLLDEPTNHLDIDTVLWLEEYLKRISSRDGTAMIIVTHDRAFARAITTRVAELDRGQLYTAECGIDEFQRRREIMIEQERSVHREFDRKLAEEEVWLRKGVKARRRRNEGRVKRLLEMRETYRNRRQEESSVRLQAGSGLRSGDLVFETEDLSFSYGTEPIVSGLTTTVMAGDRVGVVGPNGCGKTTLLRLLIGDLSPVSGSVYRGTNLQVAYFDQMRALLAPDSTVFENIGDGYDTVESGGKSRHVIAYARDYLFSEADLQKPAGVLSGGETNRLLLAKLFARPSNLLVLDEPSNDLDADTLDLLEELLLDYSGTILLVSHDREFLDNVVTGCLVFSGPATVTEHVGGYSDWRDRIAVQGSDVPESRTAGTGRPGRTGTAALSRPVDRVRKLSFRETQELEALPERIAGCEAEMEEIHQTLADADLYRSDDGGKVQELSARLARLEQESEQLYERWQELLSIEEGQTS
ncbi:MAG: ATP-binding cassette domain-containing protein [Spirochaetaceae bacterium]|nr:MAG: ATP-binding cassette domain-containing protein [Spirochaetaceae bacterium]